MAPQPILVVNKGSSSVKLALCDPRGRRLWQQQRSWGLAQADPEIADSEAQDLPALLETWLAPLLAEASPPPDLVVHRMVHGGRVSWPLRRSQLRC